MLDFDLKSFCFIRHGETDWNRSFIYQGQNDIPLNDVGIAQAQERAKSSFRGVTEVFTSPLARAKRTAEIITEHQPSIKKVIIIPELMECASEESARFVLGLKGVESMPSFEHVKGNTETPNEFLLRVARGLKTVLTESTDDVPVIVAHGGVCTAICKILSIDFFRTPNCCMVAFELTKGRYSIRVID